MGLLCPETSVTYRGASYTYSVASYIQRPHIPKQGALMRTDDPPIPCYTERGVSHTHRVASYTYRGIPMPAEGLFYYPQRAFSAYRRLSLPIEGLFNIQSGLLCTQRRLI